MNAKYKSLLEANKKQQPGVQVESPVQHWRPAPRGLQCHLAETAVALHHGWHEGFLHIAGISQSGQIY